MAILKAFELVFFAPGDLVRRALGLTMEQDAGVLRSFINSIFWGGVALFVALKYF